jgi:hypothetical protein
MKRDWLKRATGELPQTYEKFVKNAVEGAVGFVTGKDAEKATKEAAKTAAAAEMERLAYLKDVERIPRAYREAALGDIGAELGYTFDDEGNLVSAGQDLFAQAQASPMRQAIIDANRFAGEQAIARNLSATGGLRGGAGVSQLAGFGADLENRATIAAYQDLLAKQGTLLGQPLQTQNIAQSMSNVGQIQAQGIAGAEQAKQAGISGWLNTMVGAAQAMAGRPNTTGGYQPHVTTPTTTPVQPTYNQPNLMPTPPGTV